MKCPECGKEIEEGIVKVQEAGSLFNSRAMIGWYPNADKEKFLQKNAVSLRTKGQGGYCDECMKVFAIFEEC